MPITASQLYLGTLKVILSKIFGRDCPSIKSAFNRDYQLIQISRFISRRFTKKQMVAYSTIFSTRNFKRDKCRRIDDFYRIQLLLFFLMDQKELSYTTYVYSLINSIIWLCHPPIVPSSCNRLLFRILIPIYLHYYTEKRIIMFDQ